MSNPDQPKSAPADRADPNDDFVPEKRESQLVLISETTRGQNLTLVLHFF